ncbi:MAG: LysR family transcriptional regulator [Anaerolineae bacterium]|nr:LysR family transcriptional regulator [Anaerolineae bacterium]
MELHHLQTFVIVAEEQSITRAARRLYTTPSAVSMHIKALEDELNVRLFVRSSRGMQITEIGERLREKARSTLHAAQEMVNYASASQEYLLGNITLGLNASPRYLRIAQLIKALNADCPGIDLLMKNSSTGGVIAGVKQGQMDVGFCFGEINDPLLISQPLGVAELVIAAPIVWAAQLADADWESIACLPWINTGADCPFQPLIDALFTPRGISYRQQVQTDDEMTRGALVAAGVGISLLERQEAQELVDAGSAILWAAPPTYCDLSIIYPVHRQHDPLIKAVMQRVRQVWEQES